MSSSKPATTWGIGEYELMAKRLHPVATELVDLAAVAPGDAVLDLACGTGNAALIAAAYEANVVGLDTEPRLLEIAESRARSAGASIDWICADVLSQRLPERSFSAVLSAFGVMYVPDQRAAAAALARTSAPGARIALASWTPGSFMPAMGGVFSRYLPAPPPGSAPPSRWGDEQEVHALLGSQGIRVQSMRRSLLRLTFADGGLARQFLIQTAGNVLAERSTLERDQRWSELEADLDNLIHERNVSAEGVELGCEYLVVLARADAG